MKILLATDGSPFSQAAASEISQRSFPPGTEVKIISVVHPSPFIPDPTFVLAAAHYESLEQGRKSAAEILSKAAKKISESASQLRVTTEMLEGSPKQAIVEEAERWGADLVIVGRMAMVPLNDSFSDPFLKPCRSMHLVRSRSCATEKCSGRLQVTASRIQVLEEISDRGHRNLRR